MNIRTKKIIVFVILLMTVAAVIISQASHFSPRFKNYFKTLQVEKQREEAIIEIKKEITENLSADYLEVDFICQAPLQTKENWEYHEESCEEAALLQAYLYKTETEMTKQAAHIEILNMINWQIENMGSHRDLYAEEMKEFIVGYYSLDTEKVKIINNATIDDIKTQISLGHPIIAPVTGEILDNPYYPYPGYHMLTIIGYTEDMIITNDNGTKRGKDFSYDIEIFEKALTDTGANIIILDL
jgi:hypothetical protein